MSETPEEKRGIPERAHSPEAIKAFVANIESRPGPCVAVYGTDYGITAMYGMGATIATRLKEFDAERHGFRVIGIIDLKHNAFEQIPSRIETLVQKEVKTMFRNNKPDKLRIIDTRTG